MASCSEDSSRPLLVSYESNFVGKWKCSKSGKNLLISGGEKAIPDIYDKENKVIRMNVGGPLDIMHLENEDMLVVSGFGKYRRVTSK